MDMDEMSKTFMVLMAFVLVFGICVMTAYYYLSIWGVFIVFGLTIALLFYFEKKIG